LAASLLCLHPATHPIADICSLSSIVAPELPRTATGKTEPRITRITRINKTFVLGSDRRYPHCYRWKSSCSAKIFLSILGKSFTGGRLLAMEIRPTPSPSRSSCVLLRPIRVISVIRGQKTSVAAEPRWVIRGPIKSRSRATPRSRVFQFSAFQMLVFPMCVRFRQTIQEERLFS